jgi:tetratricopeptide (TPR) repeat protein/O-antigen ligase
MGNAIFLAAYLIMVIPLTASRLMASIARAGDHALPERSGDGTGLGRRLIVLVAQNVVVALPLVLQSAVGQIWWAATGSIGLFVILAVLLPSVPPSRAAARLEAEGLSALLVLQLVSVFLTQSRGPWLGLLGGAAGFVILLQWSNGLRRRVFMAALTFIVVVVGFLAVFNLPGSPLATLRSVPYLGRLGQLTDVGEGTGRVRVLIWQGTLELLRTHPSIGFAPDPLTNLRLVIGYGPETMHVAYNKVYPPALGDLESRNASPDRNHNDLLDHLVMTGIVGLTAYVLLVIAALRLGWILVRRAKTVDQRLLPLGLLSGLTAHLAETQTGIAIVSTKTYFWTFLALLVALYARPLLIDSSIPVTLATSPISPTAPGSRRQRRASPQDAAGRKTGLTPGHVFFAIVPYCAAVIIGQLLLLAIASSISGGAQILVYGSFMWLVFSLAALGITLHLTASGRETEKSWGLDSSARPETTQRGVSSVRDTPARRLGSRSGVASSDASARRVNSSTRAWVLAAGAVATVVALVGAGFNLNQIAADVYQKQGNGLDAQSQFADSVGAYRRAMLLDPSQAFYALYLGRAFLELARRANDQTSGTSKAITLASILAGSPPTGSSMSMNDSYESARVVLEHARDLEPLNPDHYGNLARLYHLWGEPNDTSKLEESSHYSELAATLSPHSAQLYDEWALTLLGLGRLPDAIDRARLAANMDPPFATTHVVLGDVLLESGNASDALSEHQRALQLDPTSLTDAALDRRITRYVELGQGQAFAEAFRAAAEHSSSRAVRLSYAYILSRIGQLPAAIAQYEALVAADGTDWLSWRNLALTYIRNGQTTGAARAADLAVKYAPSDQRQTVRDQLIAVLGPSSQ